MEHEQVQIADVLSQTEVEFIRIRALTMSMVRDLSLDATSRYTCLDGARADRLDDGTRQALRQTADAAAHLLRRLP